MLRSFAAALWLCLAALPLQAQDLLKVPALSGRVVDQTATLTAPQTAALDGKLAALERERGSQVVVLLVPTTAPEDIASYAQRVGDTWKVGRADVGDGLIIVVAKADRTVRIQVAKALQGAVPDLAAKIIIDERMVPAFASGDFAGGLNAAIDRIAERIGTEGLPEPSRAEQRPGKRGFDLSDIGIFLLIGVPLVGGILSSIFGRKLGALLTGGAVGGIGFWLTTSLIVAGGAGIVALLVVALGIGTRGNGLPMILGGGGGGGFGGGGGGGFGSGGGGNFDGGGASGRW